MTISITELIAILTLISLILAAWIKINIKIKEIETRNCLGLESLRKEVEIQLRAIDSKTVGLADFLGTRVTEFVQDNKEDHNEIKTHMTAMGQQITQLSIDISKLTK